MPPKPPVEPNDSDSVQNVTLTKKLLKAAKRATCRRGVLNSECEQCLLAHGVAPDVLDFKFASLDQAKKGEHLFCEILVRMNPAAVDKFVKDFQSRYRQMLKPVFQTLSEFQSKASAGNRINKSLKLCQKNLNKGQRESEKMVKDLIRQNKSRSWEKVAITWVKLNDFLAENAGLRNEVLALEIEWNRRSGNKPLGRAHTTPMANPLVGPVVRTGCEVRVPFDLFITNGLVVFCRNIANTTIPNTQYPITINEKELVSRFDELLNHCGLLACDFYGHNKIPQNQLLDIESQLKKLISAQAKFLQEMLDSSNSAITSETKKISSRKSAKEKLIDKPLDLAARFEDDFIIAIIPQRKGEPRRLTTSPELRDRLLKPIIDAGGQIPRTKLLKDKDDRFQPEKLLRSKVATALMVAGLLGKEKEGRTTVYWAKRHV